MPGLYEELDPGVRTDIREHVYMYSGSGVRAVLRLRSGCVTDAVDRFGSAIGFGPESGGWVQATVRAHPLAVCRFVRSCGPAAVLEEPPHLREKLLADLRETLDRYAAE